VALRRSVEHIDVSQVPQSLPVNYSLQLEVQLSSLKAASLITLVQSLKVLCSARQVTGIASIVCVRLTLIVVKGV